MNTYNPYECAEVHRKDIHRQLGLNRLEYKKPFQVLCNKNVQSQWSNWNTAIYDKGFTKENMLQTNILFEDTNFYLKSIKHQNLKKTVF